MKRSSRADLYRVVAARFLSRAGSEAAFFVGVWGKAAFDLSATATQLALLMLTMGIASIGGSFMAGAMVDRYGPRRVLAAAEVVFVPAALAIAFARDIGTLTLLVGIWALVGAPVITAGASFAPFLRRGDLPLERVNAWIEGAGSLSFAVGPAAGALLVRYASVDWVFVLDAATSLAAAVLVWRVHITIPERVAQAEKRRPFSEFTQGIKTVYAVRPLRYYVLVGSLAWLAFGAFGSLEPLFFRDVVGTDIEMLGWINAVFGVGFVVGASLLPRMPRQMFSARGLAVMIALVGAGTALYVGFPDLRIIAFGAFVWSATIGLMVPLLRTLMHRDAPVGVLGRVMGTVEVHQRLGELIPLTVAPALAAVFGVQRVMIGGGIIASLIALLSLGEAGKVDRLVGRVGADPDDLQTIRTGDEPLSPNP